MTVAKPKEQARMPNNLYELLKRNEGNKVRIVTKDGRDHYGTLRIIAPMHEDISVALKPGEKPPRVAYIAI